MFRHYITSIDYGKLIELQANSVNGMYKLENKKHKFKSQNKSKMIVKKLNLRTK